MLFGGNLCYLVGICVIWWKPVLFGGNLCYMLNSIQPTLSTLVKRSIDCER